MDPELQIATQRLVEMRRERNRLNAALDRVWKRLRIKPDDKELAEDVAKRRVERDRLTDRITRQDKRLKKMMHAHNIPPSKPEKVVVPRPVPSFAGRFYGNLKPRYGR